MDNAASAVGLMLQKAKDGEAMPHVWGIVTDDENAVHWIKGQGLYVEVTASGGKYDGQIVKAAVGGDLFQVAAGGHLRSQPLAAGDHLLVVLVEGDPGGAAVAISRISVKGTDPTSNIAHRDVHEINLSKHYLDSHRKGASHLIDYDEGSVFTRLKTKGNWTVKLPDGSVIDATSTPAGYQIKLKHSAGSCVLLTGSAVQLKSPSGASWLQVTDAGIDIVGATFVRTRGMTFLGLDSTAGDTPAVQGVAYGIPKPPPTSIPELVSLGKSTRVFVAK